MRAFALAIVLVLVLALGCRPVSPTPPAPSPSKPAIARPPSRHAQGERIDVNVPLQDGGVLALAELRGKLVVLELVDRSHRDPVAERDYAGLVAEAAGEIEIVMVTLDGDGWGGDVPPFVLGWDPQGALAARLHAASMPTVLLLDREGRVATQYSGARTPGHGALLEAARGALARGAAAQPAASSASR